MTGNVKVVTTGYNPREFQDQIHRNLKRFSVLVCHRRFGKTVLAINEMIDKGLRCKLKNPQYAYFAPFYGQAKRVAWDYLKEFTKMIPGVTVNEADLRVEIPRAGRGDKIRFMLLGADNPGSIRGMYFDGVILDEFAEMDPYIWSQVIRPALSDRHGWGLFIGTPKGQNHFQAMYDIACGNMRDGKNWYAALFKASETGVIDEGELEEARAIMTDEEYAQEYECSFTAALIGAYYGKEMERATDDGRVCGVPYEKLSPVDTAWDLGIGDSMSIWFIQQVGREYRAIDYIEDSGRDIAFYVNELRKRGYSYRDHYVPHDAAARELGTGKTRLETMASLGMRGTLVKKQSLDDGINATRLLLPKMWFDSEKCARGISCLRNYERKWDAKNQIFSSKPKHNWASHGSDSLRTFAMGVIDNSRRTQVTQLPRQALCGYDVLG